jgi:hypothetical protein
VLPVPVPGEEIEFKVTDVQAPQALAVPVFFRRPVLPPGEDDATYFLREWAVPVLLDLVGLENVLLVLLAMLTEMQLVVVCPDLQILSASVLAMVALLRPLVWAGPLIVTLPQKLHGYLESPVPLVIGVEELPPGFVPPPGMVVLTPALNAVQFDPSETESYRQLVSHQVRSDDYEGIPTRTQDPHSVPIQVSYIVQTLRADRRSPSAPDGRPLKLWAQPTLEEDSLVTPSRPLSPAYRKRPLLIPTPGSPSLSPSGRVLRATVDEVIWRIREHITSLVNAGLSIDLVQRPKRPVLDRRRSTIVDVNTLGGCLRKPGEC